MHNSMMAYLSALFLSVACLLAGGIWLMLWTRNRAAYMLPTALSWLAFSAYFAMLAVSAGSAPVVERGEIAEVVRGWGFATGVVILAGKGMMLVAMWRSGRRRGDST